VPLFITARNDSGGSADFEHRAQRVGSQESLPWSHAARVETPISRLAGREKWGKLNCQGTAVGPERPAAVSSRERNYLCLSIGKYSKCER